MFAPQPSGAGSCQRVLDAPGNTGTLFPGGKERYFSRSLMPFQDGELLYAKHVCGTALKKAFPDPTCCFRLLRKQAGLPPLSFSNNKQHRPQSAPEVHSNVRPIVFSKLGTASNLSSAEAFLRLFGWTGRASLSASSVSSPRPSTQSSLAGQPGGRAAAHKWDQALP